MVQLSKFILILSFVLCNANLAFAMNKEQFKSFDPTYANESQILSFLNFIVQAPSVIDLLSQETVKAKDNTAALKELKIILSQTAVDKYTHLKNESITELANEAQSKIVNYRALAKKAQLSFDTANLNTDNTKNSKYLQPRTREEIAQERQAFLDFGKKDLAQIESNYALITSQRENSAQNSLLEAEKFLETALDKMLVDFISNPRNLISSAQLDSLAQNLAKEKQQYFERYNLKANSQRFSFVISTIFMGVLAESLSTLDPTLQKNLKPVLNSFLQYGILNEFEFNRLVNASFYVINNDPKEIYKLSSLYKKEWQYFLQNKIAKNYPSFSLNPVQKAAFCAMSLTR